MAFTRAQLRTRILRRMDAEGNSLWDTTAGAAGEVDQVMGFVFDKEWRRILNANPDYKTNRVQLTADSEGKYSVAGLTTGSGNSIKRFYRMRTVTCNNRVYEPVLKKDYILAPGVNVGHMTWYLDGDSIQLMPVEANKVMSGNDGFHVNWIPCRIDNLASDSDTFDFPDGYEEILALEAAAFLLAKGGTETDVAAQFRVMAESLRQDMLSDLARFSTNPTRMQYSDFAHDWAG